MNIKDLDTIIDDVTWSHKECGTDVPQNILDTLNEIKQVYNVLDEYNVTPQNIRAVLLIGQMLRNQPTFKQCIHEWKRKGFEVDVFDINIDIYNYNTVKYTADEVEFNIDLISKQVSMPNGCYARLDFKIYHLLSQTLKALEDKNDKN